MANKLTHIIKTDKGINNQNGCYFCSNMRKDPKGGVMPDYSLVEWKKQTSGETTEWMQQMKAFIQRSWEGNEEIFGRDSENGDLYIIDSAVTRILRGNDYGDTTSSHINHNLALDSKNEVIYVGNQYIGRTATDSISETGGISDSDTTITLNDASSFPSSGYAILVESLLSGAETIQYTGKSGNDLTGVTRGKFNSSAASHNNGTEVIGFDDTFKDLGSAETSQNRPAISWEDWVFVGNVDKVAGYKKTDGSDFSTSLLDLPTGYEIVDFSTLLTGAGLKVLIAANYGSDGDIFVWDGVSDSWDRVIEVGENIRRLYQNFIGVNSGIYQTDGYNKKLVAALPDDEKEVRSSDFSVYDIKRKENFLVISANCNQFDRNRGGLWILDLDDRSWYLVSPANYGSYSIGMRAIHITPSFDDILVSHEYNAGAIEYLATGAQGRGSYYQFIYHPNTQYGLRLDNLRLDIDTKLKQHANNKTMNFDIVVRIYDFKKPFLQYSQLTEASSAENEMVITDTIGVPEVGDRVEIIERGYANRADVAGAPRNVTAVTSGTGKYTLTLDDDLPAQIGSSLAGDSAIVIINSLKKVNKIEVDDSIDLGDLKFEPETDDPITFKKLMIEVEFRTHENWVVPRLNAVEINSIPWQWKE